MKVVFTGGGTGGHIYPALAVISELLKFCKQEEILFIGTPDRLEATIIPEQNIPFVTIKTYGFRRDLSIVALAYNLKSLLRLIRGKAFREAKAQLKKFAPEVVVGTGGYVCAPVILAAKWLKIPTILLEQNRKPGLTVRWLSRFVDQLCLSFEESSEYFSNKNKLIYTGNPIRSGFLNVDKEKARKQLQIQENYFTITAFGGSLGAQVINNAIFEFLGNFAKGGELHCSLSKKSTTENQGEKVATERGGEETAGEKVINLNLQIIHSIGKRFFEESLAQILKKYAWEKLANGYQLANGNKLIYYPLSYIKNMDLFLAASDLAICRAGATTIAELTAYGIPSILVPWSKAVNHHQELNAALLEEKGAAVVISDDKLSGSSLWNAFQELLRDQEILKKMHQNCLSLGKPEAAETVANIIQSWSKNKI